MSLCYLFLWPHRIKYVVKFNPLDYYMPIGEEIFCSRVPIWRQMVQEMAIILSLRMSPSDPVMFIRREIHSLAPAASRCLRNKLYPDGRRHTKEDRSFLVKFISVTKKLDSNATLPSSFPTSRTWSTPSWPCLSVIHIVYTHLQVHKESDSSTRRAGSSMRLWPASICVPSLDVTMTTSSSRVPKIIKAGTPSNKQRNWNIWFSNIAVDARPHGSTWDVFVRNR